MSDVPAAEPLIELDSAPADDDPRWRRTPARSMLGAGLGLLLGGLLFMARRLRDAFRDATFTDGELRLLWLFGGGSIAVVILVFAVRFASWRRFRYALTDGALHTRQGALFRTARSVPLDRIEAVNLREPFLERLLGLASLRIEVAGGGESRVELPGLAAEEAASLRTRLLAAAEHPRTAAEATPVRAHDPKTRPGRVDVQGVLSADEEPLAIAHDRIVAHLLLRPSAWVFAVAAVIAAGWAVHQAVTANVLAAMVPTMVAGSLVVSVVRSTWDGYWRLSTWRVGAMPEGVQVSHGRLVRESATIASGKVLAVVLTQGPLMRRHGLWRVRGSVAGFSDADKADGEICPLATASDVERMMPWVMPALGDEGTGLVQTMSGRVPDTDPWSRPAPHARWFAPFGWRHRAVMLGDRYVTVRSGRFRRDVRVIDRTRLQAIQAIAGPVDRRLGLSNLYLYLPRGTAENTVAKHFSASLVEKLRDDLVLTSRPFR